MYRPLSWALVRAPLLPANVYLRLAGTGFGVGEAGQSHDGAAEVEARVRTALAVGSPSLFDALERSERLDAPDGRAAAKRLRYLIRMSTRPTPYGLFAGVGISYWGRRTDLGLSGARPRTRTRPGMEWLLRLAFQEEERCEVRGRLRYFANPRIFFYGGRVLLPEPAPTNDKRPREGVSVRDTTVVRRVLALARTPVEHDELVAALSMMPTASTEKVEALINELWRQTFLLTDIRPPMTVPDPSTYLVRRLGDVPDSDQARQRLQDQLAAMAAWDELPLEDAAPAFRALVRFQESDANPATQAPPQVDMALALSGCRVSEAVAKEAARAAELLVRLTLSAGRTAQPDCLPRGVRGQVRPVARGAAPRATRSGPWPRATVRPGESGGPAKGKRDIKATPADSARSCHFCDSRAQNAS